MDWYAYTGWWTLWDGNDRVARLYNPESRYERWSVALMKVGEGRENIQLDPTLTEDEAKAVVVTLARSQL
jgi:hypothetical protein